MKNSTKFSIIVFLLLLIGVHFILNFSDSSSDGFERVFITKVVDGDTVKVGDRKIRIIGINTPELKKEKLSREARDFGIKMLTNSHVYLEKDVEEKDRYGRELRYVWIEVPKSDSYNEIISKNYSALILKEGLARTYTFKPNTKYVDVFKSIEKESKKNKIGMWKISKNGTTRGDKK